MTIDDGKLIDAADAILAWTNRELENGADNVAYPPDLMGTPDQPREFAEFLTDEIEEATTFLIRAGFYRAIEDKS